MEGLAVLASMGSLYVYKTWLKSIGLPPTTMTDVLVSFVKWVTMSCLDGGIIKNIKNKLWGLSDLKRGKITVENKNKK